MESENEFDLSTLSYDDFLLYFLRHPQDDTGWTRDMSGEEYAYWVGEKSNPEAIVHHMTRFFNEFGAIADTTSLKTLDHVIDGMLGAAGCNLQTELWNDSVPLDLRLDCIRSMYRPFADFVANCKVETMENGFYVWWDFICTGFWFRRTYDKVVPSENYQLLGGNDRNLVDCMFETLTKILALEDDRCQSAALHGLGHLQNPAVRDTAQKYMNANSEKLTRDGFKWLERCRDGTVM
jgi:hypothetical protein